MRRRRSRRPEAPGVDMELTPMIDVVFNLLVFFMLQRLVVPEGVIHAYLPKQGTGNARFETCDVQDVRIKLLWHDAQGKATEGPGGHAVLKLGGDVLARAGELEGPGALSHPGWAELGRKLEELRALYRGPSRSGLPVVIDARKEVPTQLVILALNEAVRAGIRDVTFAAPSRPF